MAKDKEPKLPPLTPAPPPQPPTGTLLDLNPEAKEPLPTQAPADTPTRSPAPATRFRLPSEREAKTMKFTVGGHDGYATVGFYTDGRLGELFIRMAKEGSTVSGYVDAVATATSVGLQHGVPIEVFADKYIGAKFEPNGLVTSPDSMQGQMATSVLDLVFRWIIARFGAQRAARNTAAV